MSTLPRALRRPSRPLEGVERAYVHLGFESRDESAVDRAFGGSLSRSAGELTVEARRVSPARLGDYTHEDRVAVGRRIGEEVRDLPCVPSDDRHDLIGQFRQVELRCERDPKTLSPLLKGRIA